MSEMDHGVGSFETASHWRVSGPIRSKVRMVSLLGSAARGWLGQGQDNERFAGHRADVVVQAHHLDVGDILDHRLHERLRRFDQLGPYLLEQIPPLLGWEFGKLLFGGCQQPLEPDDDEIAEQVGVNVSWDLDPCIPAQSD